MNTIEILSHMDAPFAFALIGVAWAISMPLIIRRTLRNIERVEELKLKRAIQLEQFKKGALTYAEEQ